MLVPLLAVLAMHMSAGTASHRFDAKVWRVFHARVSSSCWNDNAFPPSFFCWSTTYPVGKYRGVVNPRTGRVRIIQP